MKKYSKTTQWIVFMLLFIWGTISFFFFVGEDAPQPRLSFEKFLLIKSVAGFSFYLSVKAGVWLNSKGLIPEVKEDDEWF